LDELKITHLTEEDKKFLEEFVNLEMLAMNNTGLKSLQNLPEAPELSRVSGFTICAILRESPSLT
jgi:hypothetical protein